VFESNFDSKRYTLQKMGVEKEKEEKKDLFLKL
jgi:hypothetical protein